MNKALKIVIIILSVIVVSFVVLIAYNKVKTNVQLSRIGTQIKRTALNNIYSLTPEIFDSYASIDEALTNIKFHFNGEYVMTKEEAEYEFNKIYDYWNSTVELIDNIKDYFSIY